jgi:HSP20 family molecular chaperone IbpA
MAKNGGGERPHFDWDEFQKRFMEERPWQDGLKSVGGGMPWLEEYVKELVSGLVPRKPTDAPAARSQASAVTSNVFDTHQMYIIRMKLPPGADVGGMELSVSSHELTLKQEGRVVRAVKLPGPVQLTKCKAVYKNNVIEVRVLKENFPSYRKIKIQGLH